MLGHAAEKRNLEIRLIQSQLKPHLLYNTLESAAWAIRNKDNAKAEALVYALSNFFRYILSKGSEWITVGEEIEILNNYINIQNLSREKRFELHVKIPRKLLSYKIPRMTLQPILENSILHGFFGYCDDGVVTIRTKISPANDTLAIIVRDNGIGIEDDMLEELNKAVNAKTTEEGQLHFGMYSINRRIQNLYGKEYGLTIKSRITEFTEVNITLPYKP